MEYRRIDYVYAWAMGTVMGTLILIWAEMNAWVAFLGSAVFAAVCAVLLYLDNQRAGQPDGKAEDQL